MRKLTALLLALMLVLSMAATAFAAEGSGKATIGGLDNNTWFTKYGNVMTDCTAQKFINEMGFNWGDLVTVKFLKEELTLPVIPTYSYVESGKPAIIVGKSAAGVPEGYVSLAINMGNFGQTYGMAKKMTDANGGWYWVAFDGVTFPMEVSFDMAEKGGYMAEYLLHDLTRTNVREDYKHLSDAEYANFREVETSGIGDGKLYRTSSPINPELNRHKYTRAPLKEAGVTVIMNLADDEATAKAYPGFVGNYYSNQKVIYLNLGVDFAAEDFKSGLAEGLKFFAQNEGVYAVHCTEGKDRAGFVSALLECLTGATIDEVIEDYMITYTNYYGVEKGTEKYNAIAQSNIVKTLKNAFGVEDLAKADLAAEAAEYIVSIGLSNAEVAQLRANLGAANASAVINPSTGAAA
ncbi:MAG: tyrosine-protein phosphatase [Oscillospiraceae bacterium]|nr:tyrosine-protein phosphatase [Oscillospiraceae bacterium]